MRSTPKNMRLHIGIFGRRNVGKSSLLNAITRQAVSIVSAEAGTTTDPVEKPMELLPLGPVLFIDTAGIDDEGALGEARVARTRAILDRADLAILVAEDGHWGRFEAGLLDEFSQRYLPVLVALNKCDLRPAGETIPESLRRHEIPVVRLSATTGQGLQDLRQALLDLAPEDFFESRTILSDLVPRGRTAVLVIPIDKEAPKGRIILPQVQAIRDLLDHGGISVVVQERELQSALANLCEPPALVVTDSQAFREVAAIVPPSVSLTSFSILFSRFQGDLVEQVRGTLGIERLREGDRILVAESCTHHPIGDDIGRVKIPHWLRKFTGLTLNFSTVQGHDFPQDLSPYSLVIHCGSCMGNRKEMLSRILRCRQQGVPITNYGLTIAYSLGIFERALAPFPEALGALRGNEGP